MSVESCYRAAGALINRQRLSLLQLSPIMWPVYSQYPRSVTYNLACDETMPPKTLAILAVNESDPENVVRADIGLHCEVSCDSCISRAAPHSVTTRFS